jgi:AIPR protein
MKTQFETKVVKFNVTSDNCRTFPDPNNLGRKRYFAQVSVDEIHRARIDYGPNPRNQNMETKVAEAIRESLKTESGWFLYYNKGIVLNAESVEYDNKTATLKVELKKNVVDPWESPNGNMDGGHTNRVILDLIDNGKWENPKDPKLRQYVTLEILTGIDPQKLSSLVGARNTNTPVKDLSLAVLGKELDWLLEILNKAGVKDRIAWRQFDYDASVTGEEVLAYLSLLNPQLKEKLRCYTGAGRLVSDLKLRAEHNGINPLMEGLKTTAPLAVHFLTLVDFIHKRMEPWYLHLKDDAGENSGFGNLSGVSVSKDGHELVFLNETIRYKVTKAWLMPLAHAFTGVVTREANPSHWRSIADSVGPQLMENLVNMTKNEKYNLNALGKNKSAWDTLTALVEAGYWKQKASK